MSVWKIWKSGFDRWEQTTSGYLDQALRSPAILGPTGSMLKAVMNTKSTTGKVLSRTWNAMGLTSRDDQDLAMHRINQLESQILDLQDEIRDLREKA
ncbi:MAG: hypothetical protein GY811_24915 [Myxococcales bacterium]|nr:hypothetical protein [Myxococcales bacterium]